MTGNEINGIKVPFVPITGNNDFPGKSDVKVNNHFESIFQKELEKVKFSTHASRRLESRNISLSETDLQKLESAVGKAAAKGAKDSLVMMDKTAFIVNIPNKTVVTAMGIDNESDNIYTNIDSVVFAQ